ncbi:DUF4920 domain-containing protein [Croceitalea rosinachiae]|uniref:DUF4920 domain-containing protein n=1 Tax=Croceitalea rosinachiae TaxID=3075596 RepID=A0ABU3ADD2_9FLAO|nr:DUF4920 domain-containing protein [Croceitalea sp. F388]MDT0608197.1 DUF4920 domain-containing protein [Croceitalea sp. F388]
MKTFNILIVIFLVVMNRYGLAQSNVSYDKFGTTFEKFEETGSEWKVYESLNATDTISTQIRGEIAEVCQAKGCWMKVDLDNGDQVFVKFKDYDFFVPKDAAQKDVVMNGKAFIEEMSVDEQKHYAEDKGATKEAIAKITKPRKTLRFEADGVLIEK